MKSTLFALLATMFLGGCQYLSPPELYYRSSLLAAPAPAVEEEKRRRPAVLSVAIYNVEGLAWPARSGRAKDLARIGEALAAWQEAGRAPDIVMLQEVFSREAIAIARRSGYANVLPGPSAHQKRAIDGAEIDPEFIEGRRRLKGERFGKKAHSGLYLLTDLPVLTWSSQPFSGRACAGFDCLANKGVMHARVAIPENGAVLDLFNAHFNSRGSSGVRPRRSDKAHAFQLVESSQFLSDRRDERVPIIYGGDFNTAHVRARFDALTLEKELKIAHQACLERLGECEISISADGDEPWLDTPDLQLFEDGEDWALLPLRVETLFDGGAQPALSDHDGFMVTYALVPIARPD